MSKAGPSSKLVACIATLFLRHSRAINSSFPRKRESDCSKALSALAAVFVLLISSLYADNLQQQIVCPVCNIEYTAFLTASPSSALCIDGRPADGRIPPPAECPLCHGVFGAVSFSSAEIDILKKFIWSGDFQNIKGSDPAVRHATLLEHLEHDSDKVAQAWLQAAWANESQPETRKMCLEKSLKLFKESLSGNSDRYESEKLFDLSIKTADLLRQLEQFAEAEKMLDQMLQNSKFAQGWFPMVIKHCRKLVESKNGKPSPLPTGNSLHTAITEGNLSLAGQLASNSELLNEINAAGQTPLIQAISKNDEAITAVLIKAGASMKQTDLNGNTPLHQAVISGKQSLLDIILPATGNLDPVNNDGATPLLLAAEKGKVSVINALLEAGADFNRKDRRGNTILHILCRKIGAGREAVVSRLVNQVRDVNLRNFDDYTPLHLAAKAGNQAAVNSLVQAGGNIDARLPDGSTALFFCKPIMSSSLLGLGADMKLQNNSGHTAMVHARLTGDRERMTYLKRTGRFGTRPQKFSINNSETNIFAAVKNADSAAIKEIVRRDQKQLAAQESELSETPLHLAAAIGNPEIINLLVELGSDVNATNEFMRTPMHYAAAKGNLDAIKALHKAKANIQAVDIRGSTPLHDAASARHRKVYIYLLELDASDTTRDNDGKTAAELFAEE